MKMVLSATANSAQSKAALHLDDLAILMNCFFILAQREPEKIVYGAVYETRDRVE